MRRSCKELKRIARANLENKYSVPMKAYILTFGITMLVEMPFAWFTTSNTILYIAELLISVVAIVLTCGQYRIHLAIARGQRHSLSDLYYPIKNQPDRYILAQLLYMGLTIVATVPLILGLFLLEQDSIPLMALSIPCSIISAILLALVTLNFELVFLFMVDDENLSVMEAYKKCRTTMKGHKGRYFYMSFSFLGMLFLGALSLGVATVWISPYMTQTVTAFYLEASGQLDAIEDAKKNEKIDSQKPTMFNQYV